VERLNAGLKKPLTLISAPAGFGKTSLMSEWRIGNESRIPAAWLSLDEGDNDPSRFWSYLIASLETLQHNSFDATRGLLQSPQPVPPESIASSIVHELESFPNDHVLVLDDLHVITSTFIQRGLAFLLDHLPPKSHLVILTRADPSLPLSRLRVRDQLTELRATDLRFTLDEVTAFLSRTMGLSLTPEQIASLEAHTEGWIAGLQLAALSMQGRGDVGDFVASFAGSHHYVVDYLVEEVLSLQSEKTRNFLLKTSILERMNAPLCNTLTGESDGQPMLEKLEQANLFVVGLDNERQWYRYHQLFADVLQIRLRQSNPECLNELHGRAAMWLEQNKYLPEALRHALAGGDKERAGRLAEQNDAQMLARGELVALLGWLEALKDLVQERPQLCIDKAWALMLTGQVEEVESLLERAEQLISDCTSDEMGHRIRGNIAAIRCYMASRSGDAPRCLELGQRALEFLSESNPGVRGVVHMAMGGTYLLRGDTATAIQSMREAGRLGKLAGNLHVAVTAISSVANILMAQGQLYQSAEMYREALQLAYLPDGRILPIAGRVFSGLSRLSYEWNDLSAALAYAQQTFELGQKWGNADSLVTAHVMLGRISQARGDSRSADESMRNAENLVRTRQLMPTSAEWVEMTRVWLWLVQGNLEACERWKRSNDPKPAGKKTLNEGKRLILARILLAEKNHTIALKILSQLLHENETAGHWGSVIELLVLQTLTYQQQGETPAALNTLERALSLAEPEGYIRIFLDQGKPMKELLRRMKDHKRLKDDPSTLPRASSGRMKNFVHKLLAFFDDNSSGTPALQPDASVPHLSHVLIDPLSERELEILGLITAGKSNQEIAHELVLAVGTVKKHVSNIFNKLNVDSRTRCIAQAQKLHLID
jgi:LuxR family maltose regulon positive regulatory protein